MLAISRTSGIVMMSTISHGGEIGRGEKEQERGRERTCMGTLALVQEGEGEEAFLDGFLISSRSERKPKPKRTISWNAVTSLRALDHESSTEVYLLLSDPFL
eukprot:TRINITY_DN6565_c0_g1::TRINITY_DN6565_c0_g1_i1::g.13416::m.13416 TRINITY_DN6565_c0_g1::TRINITY_DN6565_c0_g1_i1::g.13416  ORF type:complete len:102 (-),score=-2.57,Neugrin/PF06413.6/0.082 TRINITY_DN6565_c0_g1_i1:140-445(-)